MILVLKGADFSADNLGQVEVTQVLNEYTEAAIQASGNNSLTRVQKSALDNFFLVLGVDGSNNVMSKIHKLYLPIIAGDVSKAVVNYAKNTFPVDKELTDTYWELRSHGLVGKQQGQAITLTEDNPIVGNDFFSCFLRTEKMVGGIDDSTNNIILRGKSNTGLFLGLSQQSLSSNMVIAIGAYGANWLGNIGKGIDTIKATAINSRSDGYVRIVQSVVTESNTPYTITSDMSGESEQTMYVFGLANENTAKPYAVSIIGEALTNEQAKAVCVAVDRLYDAFVG